MRSERSARGCCSSDGRRPGRDQAGPAPGRHTRQLWRAQVRLCDSRACGGSPGLPDGVLETLFIRGDYALSRELSARIMAIAARGTDALQLASIDNAYIDISSLADFPNTVARTEHRFFRRWFLAFCDEESLVRDATLPWRRGLGSPAGGAERTRP